MTGFLAEATNGVVHPVDGKTTNGYVLMFFRVPFCMTLVSRSFLYFDTRVF